MIKKRIVATFSLESFLFSLVPSTTLARFEHPGKSFSTVFATQVEYQYDGYSTPPSPVKVKKGLVPTDAETMTIQRSGETQKKTFNSPVHQRRDYTLTFSLNYHNIESGQNHYRISFRKEDKLLEIQQFEINTTYKEIPLQGKKESSLLINDLRTENTVPLLIKYEDTYKIITPPYLYDPKTPYIIQATNLKKDRKKSRFTYADIRLNGEFIISSFPYEFQDAGGWNSTTFSYDNKNHQLTVTRQWADECGYSRGTKSISTETKNTSLNLTISKNQAKRQDGVVLTYKNNKKLELFPEIKKGEKTDIYALKYRYSIKKNNQRQEVIEGYVFKNQKMTKNNHEDSTCGPETLEYHFDAKTMQLFVERSENIWGKAETYTREVEKIPSFYRIRH